jgi:CheY-like chemotaxis protein
MDKIVKYILLAEDDPRDAKLTLAALEEYNKTNKIFAVNDGEAVLDYLYCAGKFEGRAGGNPAAILLDLKMPKVNGLEVLKIIKGDKNLKTIPVVVLTSSREIPDLIECYENGVSAYVVKPMDFNEFSKTVRDLGVFWLTVNDPPPAGRPTASIPGSEIVFSLEKKTPDKIAAKSRPSTSQSQSKRRNK